VPEVKDLEPAPALVPAPVEPKTAAAPPNASPPAAAAAATAAPSAHAVPDNAVYAVIDKFQVTGIRSSGSESKVLMNDRVYRVNDIVDRNLGLKLIKVTSDSLTFVDRNGATYTKNF
jgi:hypothetical protein